MEDRDKQIAALELFNEKAKKLLQQNFIKELTDAKTGILLSFDKKDDASLETVVTRRGPSQETIDAFVLTFRFFIQNNESTSLSNIANIYENSITDLFTKNLFITARNVINEFLDSPSKLGLSQNGVAPTNREIMKTFVYGELAHSDEEKSKKYKEWMSVSRLAPVFDAAFVFILAEFINVIYYIAILNQYAIENLQNRDA